MSTVAATYIQAIAAILLLVVTLVYVFLTHRISKANEQAAEAARVNSEVGLRTLEEMRAQRLDASRPRLIYQIKLHRSYAGVPEVLSLTLVNVGNGPALSVSVDFRLSGIEFLLSADAKDTIAYVQAGTAVRDGSLVLTAPREKLATADHAVLNGRVGLSYQDVYGRTFLAAATVAFTRATGQIESIFEPIQMLEKALEKQV